MVDAYMSLCNKRDAREVLLSGICGYCEGKMNVSKDKMYGYCYNCNMVFDRRHHRPSAYSMMSEVVI
jgi:uncharacterized CHY-type Zn-finger protein